MIIYSINYSIKYNYNNYNDYLQFQLLPTCIKAYAFLKVFLEDSFQNIYSLLKLQD